jgi:hypothetical protein
MVGSDFTVAATILNRGESVTENRFSPAVIGAGSGYIAALSCECANVKATISINGPATLAPGQNATIVYSDNCSVLCCHDPWNVSWKLRCTGKGKVTITVTVELVDKETFDHCTVKWSDSVVVWQISKPGAEPSGAGQSWPKPPQIAVRNVQTNIAQVAPNQPVTVMANIVNTGEQQGFFSATFKVNGQVEEVREGMLEGQTGTPVQFVYYPTKSGTYTVDVNGETTYFTVVGAGSGTGDTSKSITGSTIFIIIFSLLALGATVILVRRFV